MMIPRISSHAIERYRERVREIPVDTAKDEMLLCLASAKPKYLRRLKKSQKKRTTIIPTGCCRFIFEYGTMVTVVKELRQEAETLSGQAGLKEK